MASNDSQGLSDTQISGLRLPRRITIEEARTMLRALGLKSAGETPGRFSFQMPVIADFRVEADAVEVPADEKGKRYRVDFQLSRAGERVGPMYRVHTPDALLRRGGPIMATLFALPDTPDQLEAGKFKPLTEYT